MNALSFLTILLANASSALFLLLNASIGQVVSTASFRPVLTAKLDNGTLQSWPQAPWTFQYGSNTILFSEYGRPVAPALEYEAVTGLQEIYEQVKSGSASGRRTYRFRGGIVTFVILFARGVVMSTVETAALLVELQVLYLNHMNGPIEIKLASVRFGGAQQDTARFHILFTRTQAQA